MTGTVMGSGYTGLPGFFMILANDAFTKGSFDNSAIGKLFLVVRFFNRLLFELHHRRFINLPDLGILQLLLQPGHLLHQRHQSLLSLLRFIRRGRIRHIRHSSVDGLLQGTDGRLNAEDGVHGSRWHP